MWSQKCEGLGIEEDIICHSYYAWTVWLKYSLIKVQLDIFPLFREKFTDLYFRP